LGLEGFGVKTLRITGGGKSSEARATNEKKATNEAVNGTNRESRGEHGKRNLSLVRGFSKMTNAERSYSVKKKKRGDMGEVEINNTVQKGERPSSKRSLAPARINQES